ncbi:MAG: GntR family transcriptional regulator [Candidatus Omnitrophica bacterium]|nr:GntR family transcriptional regulator [Candidatus Omnitrophota bacterium]
MKKLIKYEPKYKQIKKIIKERISKGIYKEEERIPSEYQLIKEFNVSRHTILKALSELIGENYIYRIHGKGTFVCSNHKRRKNKIAVLVYHSENIYFSKIIREAENFANKKNYHLILCNTIGDFEKETNYIEKLLPEVDGFLVCCCYKNKKISDGLKKLIKNEFPFVLFSHIPEIKNIDKIDYVIPNYFEGMYKLGKYLIKNDYRNFIFIVEKNGLKRTEIQERLKGLKLSIKEENLEHNLKLFEISDRDAMNGYMNDGYEASKNLINYISKDRKTCIVCMNDSISIGIIMGLREKGVRIPEDVGVTGFDDITPLSINFKLTTVSTSIYEMGRKAMELLIEKIEFVNHKPQHIILPYELKIRETTMTEKLKEEIKL